MARVTRKDAGTFTEDSPPPADAVRLVAIATAAAGSGQVIWELNSETIAISPFCSASSGSSTDSSFSPGPNHRSGELRSRWIGSGAVCGSEPCNWPLNRSMSISSLAAKTKMDLTVLSVTASRRRVGVCPGAMQSSARLHGSFLGRSICQFRKEKSRRLRRETSAVSEGRSPTEPTDGGDRCGRPRPVAV